MAALGRAISALAALGYCLVMVGVSALAVLALFGFAVPVLDLFNHMQPILFVGCLLALLCAPLLLKGFRPVAAALAISATGLVASSVVYVPEFVAGLSMQHEDVSAGATRYTLMTFNVFARNETPMEIVDAVLDADPDILALQEYSPQVRSRIHAALLAHYPHFQFCLGGERAFVGLYSKIPFQPLEDGSCSGSVMNPDRTARIIAAFLPDAGQRFIIATTHHDWPAPISRQQNQLASLGDTLGNLPEPFMLVADFNSTPWSYALRDFVSRSGLTRHTRNLPTFPTLWYYLRDWRGTPPFLPIDHVMTRGAVNVHAVETGPASGSDHLPVIVEFSIPPAAVPA